MNVFIKSAATFLILTAVVCTLIWSRYKTLYDEHLGMREAAFHSAYNCVIDTYALVSQTLLTEVLQQDDILKLIYAIVTSSGEERNHNRGLLFRKLIPMYERMNQHSLRQMHFHFPNNHSMLRMHAPNLSDDDLSRERPSIVMANAQQIVVHGYESGRIVHGFRHVYPLQYRGTAIGTVELSNSFQQLRQQLASYGSLDGSDFFFIMIKKDLWSKLIPGQQEVYSVSPLDDDYVCENSNATIYSQLGGTPENSANLSKLQRKLKSSPDLKKSLAAGKDFSLTTSMDGQIYSVLFHSVVNISGNHAAYIISVTPEPSIASLKKVAMLQTSGALLLIAILTLLQWKYLKIDEQQQNTLTFLNTINNTMGDGLYTTDVQGNVTFMNSEACNLLGLSPKDVLHRNAHELFHCDDLVHRQAGCVILNSIMHNTTYRQEIAFFKNRENGEFPVELTCTPTKKRDEIDGTVTLFRNISSRLAYEDNLKKLQQQLVQKNGELEQLASIDGLTGLANRREFDKRLLVLWKTAERDKTELSALMIDIDHFKNYNDSYGHLQGDDCLRQVATIIQDSCLRPSDFAARYGGEEFVVLLPNTDIKDSNRVAQRLRNNIHRANIANENMPNKIVTVSIGLCSQIPDCQSEPKTLIDCADSLLYQAKESGRDRICC